MTISNRLKQIVKNKKLKLIEFAKICNIPYRSAQSYVYGESTLGANAVIKICTKLCVNPTWLLLGEGEMDRILQPSKEPQTSEEIDKIMKDLKPEQRQEILTRSLEMKKMNELEKRLKKLEAKLDI